MQPQELAQQIQTIAHCARDTEPSSALTEVWTDRLEQAHKLGLFDSGKRPLLGAITVAQLPFEYTLPLIQAYAQAGNYPQAARTLYRTGQHLSAQYSAAQYTTVTPRPYSASWYCGSTPNLAETQQKIERVGKLCSHMIQTAIRRNNPEGIRGILCAATLAFPQHEPAIIELHRQTLDELKERQNLEAITLCVAGGGKCARQLPTSDNLVRFYIKETSSYNGVLTSFVFDQIGKILGMPDPEVP